ncbi:MAG: hypothetical protein ABIM74_02970 [candidate division WOR-3 bacterium]
MNIARTRLARKKDALEFVLASLPDISLVKDRLDRESTLRLIIGAIRGLECARLITKGNAFLYETSREEIEEWIVKRLLPNLIEIDPDKDEDFYRLLLFSLLMPYKMRVGETRATITEFTDRAKSRGTLQIISDHFIGKIGEIAFRKFIMGFGYDTDLDWDIDIERDRFKSDIVNLKRGEQETTISEIVSIKSSKSLESAYAECPKNCHIGIFVKTVLPEDFFLGILKNISSLAKLLNHIKGFVGKDDHFKDLLAELEEEIVPLPAIPNYVVGYFIPGPLSIREKGSVLPFLGEIREEKHMEYCGNLKFKREDWERLLSGLFRG